MTSIQNAGNSRLANTLLALICEGKAGKVCNASVDGCPLWTY
jgi:hypothetical protein